jgi:hypothetical protein
MKSDDKTKDKKKVRAPKITLKFTCPDCGSHDLRVFLRTAYYPLMLFDRIEVNPCDFEDYEMYDRGVSEWYSTDEWQGMEFQCGKCGLIPSFDDEVGQHRLAGGSELAEWLSMHCQQDEQ